MTRMKIYKILFLLPLFVLASCSDSDVESTLSGDGTKTPLEVTALLDASGRAAKTRAADKTFEASDQLLAYIRHVTWDGPVAAGQPENVRTSVPADKAPRLVTFTKVGDTMDPYTGSDITPIGTGVNLGLTSENTQQTFNLTNDLGVGGGHIFWDDFSEASTGKDLHDANHYLQSYYGYCYNGGTPSPALTEATGILGWTVQTNQSSADAFKHSDLLWSAEQTPVHYEHKATIGDETRNGIVLPYTHAMSKVTINVIAGEGFESDYGFSTTGVTLDQVRVNCTAKAPTSELEYPVKGTSGALGNVTMFKGAKGTIDERSSCPFQAIIVPSVLTVGNKLASITDMDGNEYFIYVTDNIITGWTTQLTDTDEDIHNGEAQSGPRTRANEASILGGKGHQMKSGVNYVLNVTVNKTEVTVSAMILDWTEVTAEGEGEIFFEHDIKDVPGQTEIEGALKDYGFDIYKSTDKNNFGAKATSLRWNRTSEKWRYNPTIYWMGGKNEYFRALSNVKPDASGTPVNESLSMENGRDALWGTTPAHSGEYDDNTDYSFGEGAALSPRTGKVPLQFYHAMAKITINLEDISRNSTDPSARLDLHGATIQLTNLATGGTIELDKGIITPGTKEEKTFSEDRGAIPSRMGFFAAMENDVVTDYNDKVTVRGYFITPQTIGNDALLIVTLANGTTYKTKLNQCKLTGSSTSVGAWERNKHYIYDITLAKDEIMFRAEIKEWEEVEVNGIITPEW